MSAEKPVVFSCAGDRLIGILHEGESSAETGVVILVGGPQYRAGSHRQFVVIARKFAAAGIPVLRFDHRGVGDAEGVPRSFTALDEDIRAAIDLLLGRLPSLKKVVLLGLCDAASAALMYAPSDCRVVRLILLNPWARTEHGEAKSYLRHYYLQRVFQKSFWNKVLGGEFRLVDSLREFCGSVKNARAKDQDFDAEADASEDVFLPRMLNGLQEFEGPILFLISGRDLTAKQFVDRCRGDRRWKDAVIRTGVTMNEFPTANHTMSMSQDLDRATELSVDWLVQEIA